MPREFTDTIDTPEALREVVGLPRDAAVRKDIAHIDAHLRAFIAKSPFLLLGTSSAAGNCDVSPKGDAPGFVHVLDEHTIVIPDRPGNQRADSLSNIVENPHVGLLFIVPGKDETLRVNGTAQLVRDADILDACAVGDKRPKLAIAVDVQEAFLHCARCFKRSKVWETDTWPARDELASMAQMMVDQLKLDPAILPQVEQAVEAGNRTLY